MKRNGIESLFYLALLSILLIGCQTTSIEKPTAQKTTNKAEPVTEVIVDNNRPPKKNIKLDLDDSSFSSKRLTLSTDRIFSILNFKHYEFFNFDDTQSKRVFEQLLKAIDPTNEYLSQTDIDELKIFELAFDDMYKRSDLTKAEQLLDIIFAKINNRLSLSVDATNSEFTSLTSSPYFKISRLEERVTDEPALKKHWLTRINNDAQNLFLLGVDKTRINQTLQARYLAKKNYFLNMDTDDKYSLVINAYMQSLDPHTTYQRPRNEISLQHTTLDTGIIFKKELGFITISKIIPTSAAAVANLLVGDLIVAIVDSRGRYIDLLDKSNNEFVNYIKAQSQSAFTLKVIRMSDKGLIAIEIKLSRTPLSRKLYMPHGIVKNSVNGKSKIGIVSIPMFYKGMSNHFLAELTKLKQQNISGLLIDLRNNGGGLFTEASDLATLFIEQAPIVQIRNNRSEVSVQNTELGKLFYQAPLAILVNHNSAGAAEIFTAAMQDYQRAIVLGEQSFGYGSLQLSKNLMRFYDEPKQVKGNVLVTTAKVYRINGSSIQKKGVTPDIQIRSANSDSQREDMKDNALEWDSIASVSYLPVTNALKSKTTIEMIKSKIQPNEGEVRLLDDEVLQQASEITSEYSQLMR